VVEVETTQLLDERRIVPAISAASSRSLARGVDRGEVGAEARDHRSGPRRLDVAGIRVDDDTGASPVDGPPESASRFEIDQTMRVPSLPRQAATTSSEAVDPLEEPEADADHDHEGTHDSCDDADD